MKLSSLRAASFAALVLLPFSAGPAASQTLQGMVFDGVSRAPIPLARVVVVDSAFTELRATVTDAAGIFSLDGSGAAYLVADRTGYAASAPIDLATAAGNHVIVTLAPRTRETDEITAVAGVGDGASSFIFGQVIDSESFRGLSGAEIELVGRGKVAVSGESGRFSIEDVQPGILVVRISHLAFETREYTLSPEAGLAYQFMVPLAPDAIELEGIEVVARPRPLARRLQDVYERLEVSQGGYFRTELDFARRGYPVVARILEAVPSVRMQKQGGLWNIQIRGCSPAFYVDGVRVAQAGDTWALSEFLNEPTMGIEVIEVFPGAATLPPEYNDPGTMCAVAAWTRRGG